MVLKKSQKLLVASALCIGFIGCGGGGGSSADSSESVTVSGIVTGNGYAKNGIINRFFNKIITPLYALPVNKPDTILAIYGRGRENKEFPINADGSFEIDTSLLNRNDITFFIIDKTTKKIYGHLNLATTGSETLDFIDKSRLRSGLDFGTIDTENNCSSSTTLSNTSAFRLDSITLLEKLSRNDDAVALYINNWKNPGITSYVAVQFRIATLSSIKNSFNNLPADLTTVFTGKSPLFYLGSSIGTDITSIDLYPPSAIKYSSNVTDSNTSLDANQSSPIQRTGLSFNSSAGVTTVETSNVDIFPSGEWILKDHNTSRILGTFEFVGAEPFDRNNKFKAIVPKIELVSDTNGRLTKAIVQLYRQLPDGSYQRLSNDEFDEIAYETIFSYVLNGSNISSNFDFNSSTSDGNIYIVPTNINIDNINRAIFSYKIGQAKYQFFFE